MKRLRSSLWFRIQVDDVFVSVIPAIDVSVRVVFEHLDPETVPPPDRVDPLCTVLRVNSLSGRRYLSVSELHHSGNSQFLNGPDVALHVAEIDVTIWCYGKGYLY